MRSAGWIDNSGTKAFKVWDAHELLRTYDRCAPWADVIVAQEWVDGPETNLYSCNCYFSTEGEPAATFIARKIRQWPPETGTSCLGEEVRNDEVLRETLRRFRSVG